MENTSENTSTGGVDVNKFREMFKTHQNPNKPKRASREEILAKYFTPRKDKEIFRILPPLPGRDYIETSFFHVVPVNAAGGKKKFRKIYCPAHNDAKVPKTDTNGQVITDQEGKPVMITKPCPLCEKSKVILAKQDPSLKGIKKEDMTPQQLAVKEQNDKIWKASSELQAKKFYIIRGVDKGAEKDGVKFWRFKHNFKQQGILDKLGPAVTNWMDDNLVDYTDTQKGTDLIVTVVDAQMPGRDRTYRDVSSITPRGSTPLYTDPVVVKEWTSNPITWREVFKPAQAPNVEPHEFLEMVANDQAPYWEDTDQNNKRWVFPGRPDLEEKANTRNQNLDAEKKESNVEMASDVVTSSYEPSINDITKEDVGTFQNPGVNVTQEVKDVAEKLETQEEPTITTAEASVEAPVESTSVESDEDESYESYDDLPF